MKAFLRRPTDSERARRRRAAGPCLALLALFAAAGCATRPMPAPKAQGYETYRVGAPDKLLVSILPDPRIEREVVVRPDGMVSIDLIGDVPAGGRTSDEIAKDIENRISRFKRGASVTVLVSQASSTAVSLLGEVRSNRSFPLAKETRVSEAIALAGGVNPFASTSHVRVIRSQGGETVVYRVDLDAIEEGDLSTNILLATGDLVYVPPTLWARFGYVVQAILFPFQPLIGVAHSVAGNAILPNGF
jgi:polysaccharide export outer membrane protein